MKGESLALVTTSGLSHTPELDHMDGGMGTMRWRLRRGCRWGTADTPVPDILLFSQAAVLQGRAWGLYCFCGSFTSLAHNGVTEVSPPRTRSFARWNVYLLLNFSMLQEATLLRIQGITATNFMPQFLLNAVRVWACRLRTLCLSFLIYKHIHLLGGLWDINSIKML